MKGCVALLLTVGFAIAGESPKTFVGVVHDNHCVGPNCATQCPIRKEPVYTLQSGEDAFILTGAKNSAQYVGKKVVITGRIASGNKLKVTSIGPAR
jgi:hypothetical protein